MKNKYDRLIEVVEEELREAETNGNPWRMNELLWKKVHLLRLARTMDKTAARARLSIALMLWVSTLFILLVYAIRS